MPEAVGEMAGREHDPTQALARPREAGHVGRRAREDRHAREDLVGQVVDPESRAGGRRGRFGVHGGAHTSTFLCDFVSLVILPHIGQQPLTNAQAVQ